MRYFHKIFLLILLFISSISPIFSSNNRYSSNSNKKVITSRKVYDDNNIRNNAESENKKFILKEIPDFTFEELKRNVNVDKDPFRSNSIYINNNSFDNLYIELLGLFKVNNEINAMFKTVDGIKNYLIGDKLFDEFLIQDINLLSKEVVITNGKESKIYKFPEK